jgi:hypothetical protein
MAALISACTKEQQPLVIWFLWSDGIIWAATCQRLSAQYGNSVLLPWSVYEWVKKL